MRRSWLPLIALAILISCQPQSLDNLGAIYPELPATRYEYNNFSDTTNALPTLGRVLFYDRQMSLGNTTSCASCHKQSFGFADNQRFSRGFEGRLTTRNSMPIQNLNSFTDVIAEPRFDLSFNPFPANHFFWDGREQNLQDLILQPVGNHIEMGITDIDALIQKLAALPYYSRLFTDAFGSEEITGDKISVAVSSFISSINTTNTRFDQYKNGSKTDILNPLELEGMMLFENKYNCNSCHQVQSPVGYQFAGTFANIGLDNNYADAGLQKTTGKPEDAGKFKIPSLRNVAFTAPYMHDGRFETLEDVIDHYSNGMADHPNLDPKLKDGNGNVLAMNISNHERAAIIEFLKTLTDESVLSDPKFSNPFKIK